MLSKTEEFIARSTQAEAVHQVETLQSLWSGYGSIVRYELTGGPVATVIVKRIRLDQTGNQPRGWNSDLGHQRKLRSYQIERYWYEHFAKECDEACRIPKCFGIQEQEGTLIIVLEDLDQAGFPSRKSSVTLTEMKVCLDWLANFHAQFMRTEPTGLWTIGTYWHLATRPEELAALGDPKLKKYAAEIDRRLNQAKFQTFVHGDAKLANFCFSRDGQKVAAVDFQYVGGGCGMKDVAYFIGSCLDELECAKYEKMLLDHYFDALVVALSAYQPDLDPQAVVQEWRSLFPVAWTDFHRFLKGWSPGHWKINDYSEQLSQQVIRQLQKEELSFKQLNQLALIACQAAKEAGQYIQQASLKAFEVTQKEGGSSISSQVLTNVDLHSQKLILNHLMPHLEEFDFGILTEEAADDGSRLEKSHFWCVDPLDGTLPFTEGRAGYAVSIALVSRSGKALIGVVYDPIQDHLYCAVSGQGVKRNDVIWKPSNLSNRLLFCSNRSLKGSSLYSNLLEKVQALAEQKELKSLEERQWGGTVMNALWTLNEGPACYIVVPKKDKGGGSIWDFAAIVAIYNELGIPATNFEGYPMLLNTPESTFMNRQGALFCSSRELQDSLFELLMDV